MAEKPEDQVSLEEKVTRGKELVGRGTRNYYVNAFADAVDDLSEACSIYADLYGPDADELAHPYLMYAKSLIAVAQDENKLMDIPEEDGDDGESEEEPANVAEGAPAENGDEPDIAEEAKENEGASSSSAATTNGHADVAEQGESSSKMNTNGTSSHNDAGTNEEATNEEEDDGGAESLQLAWEVLEIAVKILEKRGGESPELAEAYSELANISFENSFFEIAIKDYTKSFEIYLDLPEPNRRILAEIQYKIGLCYVMLNEFEQSIKSLNKACAIFDDEIEAEKAKENQTEEVKETIKDLEETKQEISNKIIEVEESKQQSIEDLKQELAKVIVGGVGASSANAGASTSSAASGSSGAGPSSSLSDQNKPKPQDISHLIKRKKPDDAGDSSTVENGAPPAKKPSL